MAEMNKQHHAYISRPFADGDYGFCLTWDKINEFEEANATGCFAIMRAMVATRSGSAAITRDVIRLALIGGGTDPAKALVLVRRYVEDRPIDENFDLAVEILEAAIYGSQEYQASERGQAAKARRDAEAAQVKRDLSRLGINNVVGMDV